MYTVPTDKMHCGMRAPLADDMFWYVPIGSAFIETRIKILYVSADA